MNFFADNAIAISIAVILLALFGVAAFVLKRIHRVAPDEAFLIVGKSKENAGATEITSDTRVIVGGGRAFVMPVFQEGFTLSLKQYQVTLQVNGPDKNRINTAVTANVNFKVQGNPDGVRKAAQRFLNQQGDLEHTVTKSLIGALRDVIGAMTIDQILSDQETFKTNVLNLIKSAVDDQGLQIDQINISDITTPQSDYLKNLGEAETARADQEAKIKKAQAKQASETAQIDSDEAIALRKRDFAIKQAEITATTEQANAQAEAAGQLARADQDKLVAIQQDAALKEQSKVTESELNIKVRRPAEAQAYAQVTAAQAQRDAENAATEGEAFKRTKTAEANKVAATLDAEAKAAEVTTAARADATRVEAAGNAEKNRLIALSEGIIAEGKARAAAAEAIGLAEAAAIKARGEALRENGNFALMQEVIGKLPEIVKAASDPIGRAGNFTIVSNDGAGAVQKATLGGITGGLESIKAILPGLDIEGLLSGLGNNKSLPGEATSPNGATPPAPAKADADA